MFGFCPIWLTRACAPPVPVPGVSRRDISMSSIGGLACMFICHTRLSLVSSLALCALRFSLCLPQPFLIWCMNTLYRLHLASLFLFVVFRFIGVNRLLQIFPVKQRHTVFSVRFTAVQRAVSHLVRIASV